MKLKLNLINFVKNGPSYKIAYGVDLTEIYNFYLEHSLIWWLCNEVEWKNNSCIYDVWHIIAFWECVCIFNK
jgi:hypothetical protein